VLGGADEGLGYLDEKKGYTGSFKTATDIGRAAMVVLGAAGVMMGYFDKYAAPVMQSALPLLTKSVVQAVRSASSTTAAASVSRMNIPSRRVATRSTISQTAGPGFQNEKALY
jgi:hypothetical protein